MRNQLFVFLLMGFLVFSCKEKNTNLSGDVLVEAKDFFAVFKDLSLPFSVADTNLQKSIDTIIIGKKLLLQFVPDSVIKAMNMSNADKIHPIGKIVKSTETYLLLTSVAKNKKVQLYTLVFDKDAKYAAFKYLMNTKDRDNDGYVHGIGINKEPTFMIGREKINKSNNEIFFTRNGWAFSATSGVFTQVVNETNEDVKRNNTILNPIDTLPKTFVHSGDYIINSKNFISVRDGGKPNQYLFFIHFEKNEGNCIGELKGEMAMQEKNKGTYTANGDPCVMDFTFEGREVTVKEQGSCGNYRDIKCYFNDTYTRKKEPVAKKKK